MRKDKSIENILPFSDEKINDGCIIRRFSAGVHDEELTWHRDDEDREIVIVSSDGWHLQMDDELPLELIAGEKIQIKKGRWHRTIAGVNELVVLIHREGQ